MDCAQTKSQMMSPEDGVLASFVRQAKHQLARHHCAQQFRQNLTTVNTNFGGRVRQARLGVAALSPSARNWHAWAASAQERNASEALPSSLQQPPPCGGAVCGHGHIDAHVPAAGGAQRGAGALVCQRPTLYEPQRSEREAGSNSFYSYVCFYL